VVEDVHVLRTCNRRWWFRRAGLQILAAKPIFPACPAARSSPAFRAAKVPTGPDWMHEIKHDGYRLIVHRDQKRVRLFTRNGWTDRHPLIVEAALRNRSTSFMIDGEAVLLGVDGMSDFDGLHSRQHDDEVQLYAFDCMTLDGDDLRKLPLSMRKTNLTKPALARRPEGIFVSDFEQGERSDLTCSGKPANSGLKVWCRNTVTAPIAPAHRRIGSR
jgi:ATP-dependent DNA ligase